EALRAGSHARAQRRRGGAAETCRYMHLRVRPEGHGVGRPRGAGGYRARARARLAGAVAAAEGRRPPAFRDVLTHVSCESPIGTRLKFAEFHPGQEIRAGPVTLSEADIVAFARARDPQWFHTDPAR